MASRNERLDVDVDVDVACSELGRLCCRCAYSGKPRTTKINVPHGEPSAL